MHPELRQRLRELGIGGHRGGVAGSGASQVPAEEPEPRASAQATQVSPAVSESPPTHASQASPASQASQPAHSKFASAVVPRLRLSSGDESAEVSAQLSRRPDSRTGSTHEPATQAASCHRPQPTMSCNAGLDPDVTDLLLKLDDLDARSEALHKIKKPSAAAPKGPLLTAPAETLSAEADAARGKKCTAAPRSAARQPPLQSLRLIAGGGSSDARWPGARCRRDHRQTRDLDLAPSFADAFDGSYAEPGKIAERKDGAHRVSSISSLSEPRGAKAATNCVPLPPLKPSASAPQLLAVS